MTKKPKDLSEARKRFEKEAEELREQNSKRKLERSSHNTVLALEPMERKFCALMAEGITASDAAHRAGYADPGKAAKQLLQRPPIRRALNYMIERTMQNSEITREDIIAGFQDAISIARQQSEAMTMIAGYREIGRMLGMYEAKVKIEVSGPATEIQRQLQGMSDADLLKLIHERSAVLPPLEGEYAEVTEEEASE